MVRTLLPYDALFGDVQLEVESLHIDGSPQNVLIIEDEQVVYLQRAERARWERATVEGTIRGPLTEMADLEKVEAFITASCRITNMRLTTNSMEEATGQWSFRVEFEREFWRGVAELTGTIAATVGGVPRRIVGSSGSAWKVRFDEVKTTAPPGAMVVRWIDFYEPGEELEYLRAYREHPYYLRVDPFDPKLLLNSGFDGLQALLRVRRTRRGPEKALHDQLRAGIASDVWAALFNAALGSVQRREDGELERPESDWENAVLDTLLIRMYPGQSPEDALGAAFDSQENTGDAGLLQERLVSAVTSHVKLSRFLREGIRSLSLEDDLAADEEDLDDE